MLVKAAGWVVVSACILLGDCYLAFRVGISGPRDRGIQRVIRQN